MFDRFKKLEIFKRDERGVGSLIAIAIVAAVLVVLFEVIPVIGYNTSTAVTIPTTSMWNSGTNLNIANGSELWSTNSPMISVGLLIGVIAVIIGLLMSSLGGFGQKPQGSAGGAGGGGGAL